MGSDVISIEKVLNSRCSSGFETGIRKRHWGTLVDKSPSKSTIEKALLCCKVPQYSNGKLLRWFSNDRLFIGFEKTKDSRMERILNIESGMQHESVYLAFTATGFGTCILNQGINGTELDGKIATASYVIKEMLNPYELGRLTTKVPGPRKAFVKGRQLSPPIRDGTAECLPELQCLLSCSKKGLQAGEPEISQLLWAAKGRTPHLIRLQVLKMMWGLTIPTWGGGQDYTTVHIVRRRKNFIYVNLTKSFLPKRLMWDRLSWVQGNPTHDLKPIGEIDVSVYMDGFGTAIVLCKNEDTNRALWEVGYMLENMFLQAKSLGISFSSKIFTDNEIKQLADKGLPNAVATLLL